MTTLQQNKNKELTSIPNMRRRNGNTGPVDFWVKLRQKGYTRTLSALFRVMREMGYYKKDRKKQNTYRNRISTYETAQLVVTKSISENFLCSRCNKYLTTLQTQPKTETICIFKSYFVNHIIKIVFYLTINQFY